MTPLDGNRRYPLRKPDGHAPAVQRYSARLPQETSRAAILFLGMQAETAEALRASGFHDWLRAVATGDDAPVNLEYAAFTDPQGCVNHLVALYWMDSDAQARWARSAPVRDWWDRPAAITGPVGQWWEPVIVSRERLETITFREYLRGVSACPHIAVKPMNESGYWGAARDRIPASADDRMASPLERLQARQGTLNSRGARLLVQPPLNLTVIKSGVSWEKCDSEQLGDWERHLRPRLDAGMDFLRRNPEATGCCSLRQVACMNPAGDALKEAYSLGYFLSLAHLEHWAEHHPTHLAIFTRAMADRLKYQERLELRTYHEVFVLGPDSAPFEYVNCHPGTGLLPFFG
jgi:hypothetical protein